MKIKIIFTILLAALIVTGCASTDGVTGASSVAQVQAFAAEHAPENVNSVSGLTQAASGQYPTSPEGVVQAFLAIYETNPHEALIYLTSGAQAAFDPALLQFNGAMEGFSIDQAAVNPDLPGAFIGVAIQISGSETRRDFTLVMENGQWKIETISVPNG
ncbi:MAG TPA: hypothetical protein VLH85_03260 [Levilinea sp.]|nr:hypothetical protein [Levilinea sp.]